MATENELQELRAEVARLEAKKEELVRIKEAKIARLRAKLGNVFPAFQAQHPYLSTAAGYLGRGAKAIGQNVVANSNQFTDYREPVILRKPMINTKRLKKVMPKKREREDAWKSWAEAYA